jgi:hypothetical protein
MEPTLHKTKQIDESVHITQQLRIKINLFLIVETLKYFYFYENFILDFLVFKFI